MPPVATDPFSESTEYSQVARNRMVAVIALHHAFQPRSDQHNRLMHPPAQLLLNGKEFCPQSLRRRPAPDHKVALRVPTTVVGEPEKREGFRLPFSALPSIGRREAPEFDQSRPLPMEFQTELCQPLLTISQEPLRVCPVLKSATISSAYLSNVTSPTEIFTLSLPDALPIFPFSAPRAGHSTETRRRD